MREPRAEVEDRADGPDAEPSPLRATLADRARVRSTLENLVDPCVLLAPVRDDQGAIADFMYADANEAACTYNRLPYDELIGTRMLDLLPGHRHMGAFEHYVRVLVTGDPLLLEGFVFPAEHTGADDDRVLDIHAVRVGDALSISWRDVTAQANLLRTLGESEKRYRLLAEHVTDIVFEIDEHGTFKWISPSVETVAGWHPEDLIGTDSTDLLGPEEQLQVLEHRETLRNHQEIDTLEVRIRTADGDYRWMTLRARPVHSADGDLDAVIVGLRDCHAEVLARRAADTLSAANSVLVRATNEDGLLADMCATAVEHGGYVYAWYCRKVYDDEHSVCLVAEAGDRNGLVPESGVRWCEEDPRGFGPTGTALRTGRTTNLEDLPEAKDATMWHALRDQAGFRSAISLPVFVDGELDGTLTVYAGEHDAFDAGATAVLRDVAGRLGAGLARLRTTAALSRALADHTLLTTAIDQSAESIVITDPSAAIMYANPAALRSTGYTFEELRGENPRLFKSGLHDDEFYQAMWARLSGGQSFHGTLVNRRKNGELYEEDATITPVHDGGGELVAYVGVKREIGREARLAAAMDQEHDDREVLLDIMRRVRPADTFEGTAAILCQVVTRLDGFDGGTLLTHKDGAVIPVGMTAPHPDVPMAVDQAIPVDDISLFVRNTRQGAWWIDLDDPDGPSRLFPQLAEALRAAGFHATAYAPVRWEGEMIALLSVVMSSPTSHHWIGSRLKVLEEFASFAGLLLGEQAKRHEASARDRAELRDIILGRRFYPVFQPIVELATGKVLGHEALTRFDDGLRPDLRFAAAHELGMGSELERVCVEAALEAAEALPADQWLSVNFTPSAVIDGTAAATVRRTSRPVVIEITEHIGVESYPAVRRAIRACRPARVSVDDAGAGFASLRHIIELEPDMVKLDIGLVHDIDIDPARQALAAGLRHFSERTGTTLIAEGVERAEEATALIELGIELAQGFHFGRPAPLH